MSHKKLREEKNCLNCGQVVEDRYCTHCGQENLQLQDSAFHLIIHYIQDLFHYDGKFWHTLKMLVLKPGQVAREFMEGKRSRNLEPLRFYVFASTIFFLLVFYMYGRTLSHTSVEPKFNYKKRLYNLEQERKYLEGSPDTSYAVLLKKGVKEKLDSLRGSDGITTDDNSMAKIQLPDSIGWLAQWIEDRGEERRKELVEKHEADDAGIASDITNEVLHKLPHLLFISLPFMALLLKILYIRPKRSYVEHFIFSIYFYAYLFVIMSMILILQMWDTTNPIIAGIISYATGGLIFYIIIYLMLAMKRFYNDRWIYLIPRYMFLFLLFIILLSILFLINILISYLW